MLLGAGRIICIICVLYYRPRGAWSSAFGLSGAAPLQRATQGHQDLVVPLLRAISRQRKSSVGLSALRHTLAFASPPRPTADARSGEAPSPSYGGPVEAVF